MYAYIRESPELYIQTGVMRSKFSTKQGFKIVHYFHVYYYFFCSRTAIILYHQKIVINEQQ